MGLSVAKRERQIGRHLRCEEKRKETAWGRAKEMWVSVGWGTCSQRWGRGKVRKRRPRHSVGLKLSHQLLTLSERAGDLGALGRMCGPMARACVAGFDLGI